MKLAVVFPGVAYYTDMPLLYYGEKLALKHGYKIAEVKNGEVPNNIKGSKEKMAEACSLGVMFAEESLKDINFKDYDEIIFISKSIGTAIGVAFAKKYNIPAKHIIYTPVEETFDADNIKGIVFHGTSDPWADTDMVKRECERLKLPLYLIPHTDHSLEGENVIEDIDTLKEVMDITDKEI